VQYRRSKQSSLEGFGQVADSVIEIDSDRQRLDLGFVHDFLVRAHWSKGIPFATMLRAIEHSLPFGLYKDGKQIGFARVVTDQATFAYLADVFVIEGERGQGYGTRLIEAVLAHPAVQGLRRWLLVTRDAERLYRPLAFTDPKPTYKVLEKVNFTSYEADAQKVA
jgi:N-acetylglutamate synthase-like GNAT family acetyltransferase